MIPLSLPEPSTSRPRHFAWLSLALGVLGVALVAEKLAGLPDSWPGDRAVRPLAAVSVAVGPVQFRLQEDLIATAYQRRLAHVPGTRFSTLRLALAWPDLAPVATHVRSAEGNAILVDLDASPGRESLRARLEPFYRRLARGGELAGPDGLKMLTLSARGAPETDLVAYDPSHPEGFIVRCRKEAPSATAVCHRATRIAAGLELRYRFDQTLLPEWRRLDSAILTRVLSMRIDGMAQ